jgi:hypothetical protein
VNEFLEKHTEEKLGAGGDPVQQNITDEESTKIMGPHGCIQGYNGIAIADSKNQIIVAAEAFGSGPEAKALPAMIDKLQENMRAITKKELPLKSALLEGDTGCFSEENLQAAKEKKYRSIDPRPAVPQKR